MFSSNMLMLHVHGFTEIVNKSKCKPNKLWVVQGKGFGNNPMQKWFDNYETLMYSTHDEGRLVVAEMFIRTLTCKIYKKLTAYESKLS